MEIPGNDRCPQNPPFSAYTLKEVIGRNFK